MPPFNVQLLRSYSLPINRSVSVPPIHFESLFRLYRLQDMKVMLFVSTLNALHSLILLPTCPYKADTVRGCLSSHPLWMGASRRAECPLLFGNLQMNNGPTQTNQTHQIANPTDHHINSVWFPEGFVMVCGHETISITKYPQKTNPGQNWPGRVWCSREQP